ncbi:hypothetical protein [Acidovorax sp. Leaf78]|uniref:hypothetical protein n=1 Tax=Acidovorax sp. Leaf78 TaxID=1736237 RepID=UPI0009E9C62A|nr:hypothetical protein [Acidovorax sp. Leaf78]
MPAASLIATHLNAPYGRIVSAGDVALSLTSGRLSAATKAANDILSGLFAEVEPRLILRCAQEEGAALEAVQRLYEETVVQGCVRSPEWEHCDLALFSVLRTPNDYPVDLESR